jgi:hypothetical protein
MHKTQIQTYKSVNYQTYTYIQNDRFYKFLIVNTDNKTKARQ